LEAVERFSHSAHLIRQACRFIQANLEENPTLAEIGAHVGLSPYHLQRVFKRTTGISPREYASARRLERFKANLRESDTVTNALYDAGYGSSSRVYETNMLGMTPATYQRGGQGMVISYVILDCPMGRLLVARTERGICSVHLGRNDDELERCIRDEYPLAHIERKPGDSLCDWVEAIIEHLQGWRPHLELPIDVQATAFQWRVWQEVCKIPYGETRTYREITAALGLPPQAEVAVAQACNDNPVAVLIPCHRTETDEGQPSEYYSERGVYSWHALQENEQHHAAKHAD
jgi:AraC family transcriptional regulator, regulatory protein of adaptative response / methylated-DNA-[protein]-cysteine methyltransferase